MKVSGFTLSELLVALGVLGVISAFTIPKIMISQGLSVKKAQFKEAIGVVSTLIRNKVDLERDGTSNFDYFKNRLDYIVDDFTGFGSGHGRIYLKSYTLNAISANVSSTGRDFMTISWPDGDEICFITKDNPTGRLTVPCFGGFWIVENVDKYYSYLK